MTTRPARISPEDARSRLARGDLLLVCAYEGKKFQQNALEGAIAHEKFVARLPTLPKTAAIAFY